MARMVHLSEELEQIEFAKRAAACFAKDNKLATYSDKEIEPGCFLAIRWGLGDDCVLVLKLDELHMPTNYLQLLRAYQKD